VKYTGSKCGYCGKRSRHMYEPGRGKGARMQHSRWWVCENGHKLVIKKGQV
jgi:hypothetical protein